MICKYVLVLVIAIVINSSCTIGKDFNYVVNDYASMQESWKSMDMIKEVKDKQDLVKIKVFYESLCPYSRDFHTGSFIDTMKKLGPYLDIHTYPYGNAETIEYDNGTITFQCQHGPAECYGNKLHACALALLGRAEALLYNSCMMDLRFQKGSNDHAADECGKSMGIDSTPIKKCAKSNQGTTLLYNYGVESKKVGYAGVPYIMINGVYDGNPFMAAVCKAFDEPPAPCRK